MLSINRFFKKDKKVSDKKSFRNKTVVFYVTMILIASAFMPVLISKGYPGQDSKLGNFVMQEETYLDFEKQTSYLVTNETTHITSHLAWHDNVLHIVYFKGTI